MVVLVQEEIAKVCGLDPASVRPDTSLSELGVDSLAAAEVLVALEMRVGKQFPVDVLRRLDEVQTVGDIAAELGQIVDQPPGS